MRLYDDLIKFGDVWNRVTLANEIGPELKCDELSILIEVFIHAGYGPTGNMYIDAHERRCKKYDEHPSRW